jgi:hypothetical protein
MKSAEKDPSSHDSAINDKEMQCASRKSSDEASGMQPNSGNSAPIKFDWKVNKIQSNEDGANQGFVHYKKNASPKLGIEPSPNQDGFKMYPHASPLQPFTPPYEYDWDKQMKRSGSHLHPLEKVNESVPQFEGSPISPHFKSNSNQMPNQEKKQKGLMKVNDNVYCPEGTNEDDSSSINSHLAMEVSSEFIKNDYLSMRYEDERALSNHPLLVKFVDRPYFRRESPQRMIDPMQNHLMRGFPLYLQSLGPMMMRKAISDMKRKEVKTKIIKNDMTPLKKPTFSGNEYVPQYKRQKTTEKEVFKGEEWFKKVSLDTFLEFIWRTLIELTIYAQILN